MGITSLWEDLEAKLLKPGQLLGYPWKVWGITVQTSYWEGWWHQNWVCSRPTNLFTKGTRKSVKNGNLSGWVQWVKWCSHIGQQMPCWQTVAAGPFWLCFACPKLGEAVERELPAKIGRCNENLAGCNFDFRAKSSWEKIFIYVKNFSLKRILL